MQIVLGLVLVVVAVARVSATEGGFFTDGGRPAGVFGLEEELAVTGGRVPVLRDGAGAPPAA